MDKLLHTLVERLEKAHGKSLVSVVLYGSAASGDMQGGFSDLNVLCVLAQVTPRELADAEPVFRWWRDQGSPAPLLLSEHELNTSTDCFSIEFRDLVRQHRILYGRDVIVNLPLGDAFYRAQVEHELRAKLLRLRQKAGGILSEKDLLRKLLADSLSTFCVLFRHALELHQAPAPMMKRDLIAAARDRFGINPAPFEKLLELREGRVKPAAVEPLPLLEDYLKEITVVIDAVDRLAK